MSKECYLLCFNHLYISIKHTDTIEFAVVWLFCWKDKEFTVIDGKLKFRAFRKFRAIICTVVVVILIQMKA